MTEPDSKVSKDQYGRKTWDVDAYSKKTRANNQPQTTTSVHDQINSDRSSSHLLHREKLLKSSINAINTHTIITPTSQTATRGKHKRFGFVCPICDFSFRDNMALIDHFNSPQHIQKATSKNLTTSDPGHEQELIDGGVRHATLAEVESTLKSLSEKFNQSGLTKSSMQQKIEARKQFEQKLQDRKRAKRHKRAMKNKASDSEDDEMGQIMGFSSFKKGAES
ncbi:U4/U6.U5 snRNP associated protein [Yamadazyma tenuis]|uniref:C2H2-type domain-containing protein n=1 Tax=Candida tenuis (strain ATCC 10573 / BCRC 21748 / CBS 615 / JCM 9827 / NBRC 10315 / NRRL Y-1498 / VKM Y-70) TaxID=590646 RepID=G3B540_CANTC|nr:uncharacterized protein CANTEDRAFT_122940 [Yamadazyma tenuis ATCC 10573]EGV63131.1 hypothetical protein CANTEDRAFT_122940 [Yamadazyma tenuis ATCC 10573]WEJ97053.1 U4/U6.U5 snRNP associated protein [Yamadazyma tenuis]